MSTRLFALLATAALALPALPSASGTTDACGTASAAFESRLADAGGTFTRDAARALQAAVGACPQQAPSAGSLVEVGPIWGHVALSGPPTLAGACGYTRPVQSETYHHVPTDGWILVVAYGEAIHDEGDVWTTYDPGTGLMTYTAQGAVWGFSSTSAGAAVLTIAGVPIPAQGHAETGCSPTNAALCWGEGHASVLLQQASFQIYVTSRFYAC